MFMRLYRLGFFGSKEGNAAIEFGLVAPMLVLGLVLMLDVGFALGERMELDRNLRAGVQASMSNVSDLDAIRDVVLAAADDPANITVTVNRTCSCGGVAVSCTAWCTPDEPAAVFINLSAVQNYDGMMLPPGTLVSQTHVQIR